MNDPQPRKRIVIEVDNNILTVHHWRADDHEWLAENLDPYGLVHIHHGICHLRVNPVYDIREIADFVAENLSE